MFGMAVVSLEVLSKIILWEIQRTELSISFRQTFHNNVQLCERPKNQVVMLLAIEDLTLIFIFTNGFVSLQQQSLLCAQCYEHICVLTSDKMKSKNASNKRVIFLSIIFKCRSQKDTKMTQFFGNNFSEDRWRKAALKNAFSLLGKQRFEHSAAFFLLAGHLKDAVEVTK